MQGEIAGSSRAKLTGSRRNLQLYTREMKSQQWEAEAEKLQQAAEKNDMKVFYNWLKEVYGPLQRGTTQLTALDGETVNHEKPEILDGFANHFDQLLNISKEVDRSALDTIAQWPNISFLDEKKCKKLLDAINATKEVGATPLCDMLDILSNLAQT